MSTVLWFSERGIRDHERAPPFPLHRDPPYFFQRIAFQRGQSLLNERRPSVERALEPFSTQTRPPCLLPTTSLPSPPPTAALEASQ